MMLKSLPQEIQGMPRDPSDVLRQAMEFFIAGHIVEARALLLDLVRSNPTLEAGWMFLCYTLDDPQQKLDCLQQVLTINPENEEAQIRLEQVRSGMPQPSKPEAIQGKSTAPTASSDQPGKPSKSPVLPIPSIPVTRSEPGARRSASINPPTAPSAPHVSPFTVDISYAADALPRESGQSESSWTGGEPAALLGGTIPTQEEQEKAAESGKPEAAEKPAAKKSPASGWLWAVIFFFLIAVAGGVGFWAYSNGYLAAVIPEGAPAVTPGQLVEHGTPPVWTLPPQWTLTPTPTQTPVPPATQTPTPLVTPTLAPPAPAVLATMKQIEQQVVSIRDLTWSGDLPIYIVDKAQAENILQQISADSGSVDTTANEARVLTALGLIRPGFDLARFNSGNISDAVVGFYDPKTNVIYILQERMDILAKMTFAHEFDHALVSSHFAAVGMLDQDPVCRQDSQRCEAIRALVEGDATALEGLWYAKYSTNEDHIALTQAPKPTNPAGAQYAPPFSIPDFLFPYQYGSQFVSTLYQAGQWAKIDDAYRNLPLSTEQIMHPEKYLAGEKPVSLNVPDLSTILGGAWQPIWSDTLGEFKTYLILGYGVDTPTAYTPADLATLRTQAQAAAAGWGGDHLLAYYNENQNQTLLVTEWVWDTAQDKTEFSEALLQFLNRRFSNARVDRPGAECWGLVRESACIFQSGVKTLWILAPDMDTITSILTAYPGYE
jgi:hypothetical protein